MNEPENKPDDIEPHEWEYLDDRDEPYPQAWQDRVAHEVGVPRWGPI